MKHLAWGWVVMLLSAGCGSATLHPDGGTGGGAAGASAAGKGGTSASAGRGGSAGSGGVAGSTGGSSGGSTPGCTSGAMQCNGLQPQTCDANGAWQNTGTACPFVCAAGACVGTCTPGAKQCSSLQPQQCDANGAWQNMGAACPSVCNGGTCTACTPTTKQCNGLQPQTCDATGTWQNTGTACQYVCAGAACTGSCTPTAKQCSILQPQTCDATGTWQNTGTACPYICASGACTGSCTPNAKQCNGQQPQTCDATGAWQNTGTACAGCMMCAPSTATCAPVTNGTSCNDGNACTQTDSCQSGTCTGSNPVVCATPTTCHVAGTCNTSTGVCSNPTAPDSTACNANLGACVSGACNTPRFTRLGATVYPAGLSGDGSTVVGYSPSTPAFRWTRATGFQMLPYYMGNTCTVSDISTDGTYSVGSCSNTPIPVRWTGTSTPIDLGLPSGFTQANVLAASSNGSVLAGGGVSAGNGYTTVWKSGSTPSFIGNATNVASSYANAISADGSVIVGGCRLNDASSTQRSFRWTQAGGMVLIPTLPGGTYSVEATGVSDDGTKIVGTSNSSSGDFAYLWTASSMIALNVPGDGYSYGRAISGDGTTVAGTGFSGVWLSTNGATPVPLGTTLAGLSVDLGGFALNDVVDISTNGKVIIGVGFQAGGSADEGWIAILP